MTAPTKITNHSEKVAFSTLVRERRTDEALSIAEMAALVEMPSWRLAALEDGYEAPSVRQARKFARALGEDEAVYIEAALQRMLDDAGASYDVSVKPMAAEPTKGLRRAHDGQHRWRRGFKEIALGTTSSSSTRDEHPSEARFAVVHGIFLDLRQGIFTIDSDTIADAHPAPEYWKKLVDLKGSPLMYRDKAEEVWRRFHRKATLVDDSGQTWTESRETTEEHNARELDNFNFWLDALEHEMDAIISEWISSAPKVTKFHSDRLIEVYQAIPFFKLKLRLHNEYQATLVRGMRLDLKAEETWRALGDYFFGNFEVYGDSWAWELQEVIDELQEELRYAFSN